MSPEGSSVLFSRCPRGLDRKRVRAFHQRLLQEVTHGATFTCLLSNDTELQRLNHQFLGHDYPTDVLSFPRTAEPEPSLESTPPPQHPRPSNRQRPAAHPSEPRPRGSGPSLGGLSLGDLAISVDRAKQQAAEFGHSLEEEIEVLMLHGALHLLGMDHEADRGAMARQETAWRKKLGLPSSLIARSRRPQ